LDYGNLCKEILTIDPKIRYAGVCDDTGETKYGGQREGVKNLLSPEETKKSNLQALARWGLRNSLSSKVGKGKYAMAEYEKVKRITIPLEYNGMVDFYMVDQQIMMDLSIHHVSILFGSYLFSSLF
jgi:hypothetical protein